MQIAIFYCYIICTKTHFGRKFNSVNKIPGKFKEKPCLRIFLKIKYFCSIYILNFLVLQKPIFYIRNYASLIFARRCKKLFLNNKENIEEKQFYAQQ